MRVTNSGGARNTAVKNLRLEPQRVPDKKHTGAHGKMAEEPAYDLLELLMLHDGSLEPLKPLAEAKESVRGAAAPKLNVKV